MLNILETVPKLKLQHDMFLFNNHALAFGLLCLLFVIIFVICVYELGKEFHMLCLICGIICSTCILTFAVCAGMDSPDDECLPSTDAEVHIEHNLHQIHNEQFQKKHINNPQIKHHINNLLVKQEYYDDVHIKDIKPPFINHRFL